MGAHISAIELNQAVAKMLYNPRTSRQLHLIQRGRVLLQALMPRRQRIADLDLMALSPHLKRDLGIVDDSFDRSKSWRG